MLKHLNRQALNPSRVLVLGSRGFVGSTLINSLESRQIMTRGVSSGEIDLTHDSAADRLSSLVLEGDVIVFISAEAPCKTTSQFINNLKMAESVSATIKRVPISQLVYVSSDAVYQDQTAPMTESSPLGSLSIHGLMHTSREVILGEASTKSPLAIIRPTLIYGKNDPHNGYGPNKFRRLARAGDDIVLFGKGEELRDHIHVEDVAEIIVNAILYRSEGVLNAVSGQIVSFFDLAQFTANYFGRRSKIICGERLAPMPHNGYREFDNSAICKSFPNLRVKSWEEGLTMVFG